MFLAGCLSPTQSSGLSENADLSALTVSAGVLSPSFSSSILAYSLNVPNATSSITVTGTVSDANATLSANNGVVQTLSVGINTITLSVTAPDQSTVKSYVVTVNRAAADSADLASLTLSAGSLNPSFSPSTLSYSANVPAGTSSITVTGTAFDAEATLSANNGVKQSLAVGATAITITVTAKDGSTVKNYVVTVNRAGTDNADLSSLTVSAGTLNPSFSPSTVNYSVMVPNGTSAITVTGVKSDANATVSANNGVSQSIAVGDNSVTITVTAQDGSTIKNYNVAVHRLTYTLTMASIPAGTFQRDSTPSNTSVLSAFRLSVREITRTQFSEIMGTDPSDISYSSGVGDPVQKANWYQAITFCNKLSLAEGLTPVYGVSDVDFSTLDYSSIPTSSDATWDLVSADWTASGYRLPTETEWMWAAMGALSDNRSGDMVGGINTGGYSKGYAGSTETAGNQTNLVDYAWYNANSSNKTHPTGTAGTTGHPNELGLYDMSGNVWEWCWDWYADSYPTGSRTDFRGAGSGYERVARGGGWNSSPFACTVGYRYCGYPYRQDEQGGFRVARRN